MAASSAPFAFSRRALVLGAAALAGASLAPAALAQAPFPSKPVTFVVPYPAGGANDMLGRLIGQKMGEALGATVIIDNKPGAGALLGANAVAKAPADGHTVLVGGLATHAASPHLIKADYDPVKDFEAIGLLGQAPIVVITANESPLKTLKDVGEIAKKKPGEMMYGSSGNGSPLHLAGEMFDALNGSQMTHVPYKGGNAHIIDLIGGRVPVIFDTATNSMPLLRGGKVRALAVSMPQRLADLPNVPTFAEAGYPGFQFTAWYGLFAPARTPKDVVAKLSAALQTALKQPEVIEKLRSVGVSPASGDSAELARLVPVEYERIGKLIKTANIKAD
ncbi:tripartite-type tricarboxylate transporter receptor subunit TctC [Sphaerotilus hippei]|uniref:Tripartite-type tricarboxylate transporter receptor subunit TctC n=1 Tax=Sphaerotilus hippei TaxID=744406 RepID=A0A318HH06_9BURK|nr:tripartite tricarboxylate transporter substrate binding protein [Sphaerotilus hippei]PXW99343.1 tripartite-type tricarboxylate transporter receptor subunit TctC [Sphaerotilus hippei]